MARSMSATPTEDYFNYHGEDGCFYGADLERFSNIQKRIKRLTKMRNRLISNGSLIIAIDRRINELHAEAAEYI